LYLIWFTYKKKGLVIVKKKLFKLLLVTIGAILPVSYFPFGKIAKKFRYYCASKIVAQIGKNVNIEKGSSILPSTLKIGDNSGIGINAFIGDYVTIGNNVMMGPDCLIYTQNHRFDKDKLQYVGCTETKPVIIQDDVWIGARVIILPGVTIGKGSTIGAGAIVSNNIPEYSVAVGNPAKVVKKLKG